MADEVLIVTDSAIDVIETPADQGPPGVGVPAGGTVGQVLAKASGADFDTSWVNPPAGGGVGGGSYEPAGAVAAHEAALDPHPQYMTAAESAAAFDPLGAANDFVVAHAALPDPHPQYMTSAESAAAFAAIGHGHAVADVAGLQLALDGKSASGHDHAALYAALAHAHAIAEVTGLQLALDGKAAAGHDHNLVYALLSHDHAALYAALAHAHAIADVTGLQAALDGKASSGHNHDGTYSAAGHNHDTAYAALAHNHDATYASIENAYSLGNATGAVTLNAANGELQYATSTGATTWTLSGAAAAPLVTSITLELTNGGAFAQTWPSSATLKWDAGTAPTLTAAGLDILVFYTRDGGTTWRGFLAAKDSK